MDVKLHAYMSSARYGSFTVLAMEAHKRKGSAAGLG
jgi:hypothetical protein